MAEIWEAGRCSPFEMLYSAVNGYLHDLKKHYPMAGIDEREDIDLNTLVLRLKQPRELKGGSNLMVWNRYINKTAYNQVLKVISKKRECGTCRYLTESNVCQRKEFLVDGEVRENPVHGERMERTRRACEGYSPFIPIFSKIGTLDLDGVDPEGGAAGTGSGGQEDGSGVVDIEWIKKTLLKRALTEKSRKQKEMLVRQYMVFLALYELLGEDFSEHESRDLISSGFGKREKTIRRDITEIRTYLEKICP